MSDKFCKLIVDKSNATIAAPVYRRYPKRIQKAFDEIKKNKITRKFYVSRK